MKVKSLKNLTYHRNGVSGNPFFSCELKTVEDKGFNFLVTFETTYETAQITEASCRVLSLQDLEAHWRGDNFAQALRNYFATMLKKGESLYELTSNFKERGESPKGAIKSQIDEMLKRKGFGI